MFKSSITILVILALILPMTLMSVSAAGMVLPFKQDFENIKIAQDGKISFNNNITIKGDGKDSTFDSWNMGNYTSAIINAGWDENYGGMAVFGPTTNYAWNFHTYFNYTNFVKVSTAIRKRGTPAQTTVNMRGSNGIRFMSNRAIIDSAGNRFAFDWEDDVWYEIEMYINNATGKGVTFIKNTKTGVIDKNEYNDRFLLDYATATSVYVGAGALDFPGGYTDVGYIHVEKADFSANEGTSSFEAYYGDGYDCAPAGFDENSWTKSGTSGTAYLKFPKAFPTSSKLCLEFEIKGSVKQQIKLSNYDGTLTPAPTSNDFLQFDCAANSTSSNAKVKLKGYYDSITYTGDDGVNSIATTYLGNLWLECGNWYHDANYGVSLVVDFSNPMVKEYFVPVNTGNHDVTGKWIHTLKSLGTKTMYSATITVYNVDTGVTVYTNNSMYVDYDPTMIKGIELISDGVAFDSAATQDFTLNKFAVHSASDNVTTISSKPFNGETDIQLDSNVTVNVNESNPDEFTVEVPGVEGTTTIATSETEGNKIVFNPTSNLAPNTTYTVIVKKGTNVAHKSTFKTRAADEIKDTIVVAPSGDKTTYTVRKPMKFTTSTATAVLVVATYDAAGKMIDCKFDTYKGTAFADLTAEVKDGNSVKAFLWESLDSAKPIETFKVVK